MNIKNILVVVFVTLKYIMMYIVIACCCNPIGDVFPSFRYAIIMYGPWGSTSILSQGSSPQFDIMKCIFGVSLGEVGPVKLCML